MANDLRNKKQELELAKEREKLAVSKRVELEVSVSLLEEKLRNINKKIAEMVEN